MVTVKNWGQIVRLETEKTQCWDQERRGLGEEQTWQTKKARTGNQVAKMRSGTLGDKSQYVKEQHLLPRNFSRSLISQNPNSSVLQGDFRKNIKLVYNYSSLFCCSLLAKAFICFKEKASRIWGKEVVTQY